MNPIQKALAQADKITDAQNALEALSRAGRLEIIDTRRPTSRWRSCAACGCHADIHVSTSVCAICEEEF